MKKIRILNLYAGIGGNRKLWKGDIEVIAVDNNEEILNIYADLFPQDTIVFDDAIRYLVKHYKEFDFIWCSPSCQTHSKMRFLASKSGSYEPRLPDLSLYELILFLKYYSSNKLWVVENVSPFYEPLIRPSVKLGRHLIWSNFDIPLRDFDDGLKHNERGSSDKGYFDLSKYKINHRKDQIIRNCCNPIIADYIFSIVKDKLKNEKSN